MMTEAGHTESSTQAKQEKIQALFEKGLLANQEVLGKEVDYSSFDDAESSGLLVLSEESLRHRLHREEVLLPIPRSSPAAPPFASPPLNSLPLHQVSIISSNGLPLALPCVDIVQSYTGIPRKYEVQDFTRLFLSRYQYLERLLRTRDELQGLVSINRLAGKASRERVSLIGLVSEISTTKKGNMVVTLEDITGRVKVMFPSRDAALLSAAKDLVLDEVIGITGIWGEGIIFVESVIFPDLPLTHTAKVRSDGEDEYAIFLSDIHVGSALFLHEEFEKFLLWINQNLGDEEHREIARKVRYIFIVGDLVDGIGVYPAQEKELAIKDINGQYQELVRLLRQIPEEKQLIICPGNHDVVHLAEPQPIIYKPYAAELFSLPNITMVSNPALVNIGKTVSFPGYDVLMYHGYSFDYYVAHVESIRASGGYHRADLIMQHLLRRRHLAPSFKSAPYYPGYAEDPLLIKKVPDFFVTGHIHYSKVANYRGVTMVSCSCWQGKTTFQEKLGHLPEPARLPVVNLKTRKVKILRFG